MIQVFLFNEGSRAAAYGVGTYVDQLINIFCEEKNYCFNIVFTRSPEKEFHIEGKRNITYFYIPDAVQDNDSFENISKYYRNVWYIMCPFIQEKKSDKIILHLNYYQHADLVDYFKRDFPSGKCCFTIHYMDWCFKIKGNEHLFKTIISSEMGSSYTSIEKEVLKNYEKERSLFNKIDKIICLSAHTKEIIRNQYDISSKKIFLSYNGLKDNHVYLAKKDKVRLKKELFLSQKEKIALFVGRLDEIKGVDILINALKKIMAKDSNIRLVLVGDGFYSAYLRECNPMWNKVVFAGKLNKADLYKLYQVADIGVLPSFHEQCSYVAIEMMMHGIPLIGTTSTGLNEMIEEGVSGLHVPVEEYPDKTKIDITLLAEKIIYLVQNSKVRKRMGLNSRKRYEALYTSEIMGRKMSDVYCSILKDD